ncbi:MAG: hypothetical protein ACO3N0_02100 [bacterium]
MSRNNTLQKTFVAILAGLILGLGPAQSVKAQFFGISLDTAIGYSAAKKGVIGGSVGITHPIPLVPNLGVSSLKFAEDSDYQSTDKSKQINLSTANSITTINIFYNVPFPVVSMAIGLGYGNFLSQTTMTYADSDDSTKNFVDEITEQKLPVTEGFIHVGLPFWNIIEFHIGYHLFSVATINLEKGKIYNYEGEGYNISKGVYTGGMSTIGIQLAF